MKQLFFLLLFGVSVLLQTSSAAENLLNNPELIPGHYDYPIDWDREDLKANQQFYCSEKDEDGNYVFRFKPGGKLTLLTQSDLILVPGAKYRFGAWVKTRNLKAKRKLINVIDMFWSKNLVLEIPENTNGWQKISTEGTVPESQFRSYGFVIFTDQQESGELLVRSPFIEALDPETEKNSSRPYAFSKHKKIVPAGPVLSRIPDQKPEILFTYRHLLAFPQSEYLCRVSIRKNKNDKPVVEGEFPLENSFIRAVFADTLPEGDAFITAELYHSKSGKKRGRFRI